MRERFLSAGLLAVFLLCVAVAIAAMVVCPKCGFENDDSRATCVHCQAELPKKAAPLPAGEGAVPAAPGLSAKLRYLDPAVVVSEIAEARGYQEKQVGVAALFLRNAQALEMLTDPAQAGNRAAEIDRLLKATERGGGSVRIKCPACDGSGQRPYATSSLRGEQTVHTVAGLPCTECEGSGFVTRRATMEDVRYRRARAADDYRMAQQARKFVPVGEAWVPQDLETKLAVRQQATIRRITAAPCPTCAGLGRLDCPPCHGDGRVKCKKCAGAGKIKVAAKKDRIIKLHESDSQEQKCAVCAGTGFVTCDPCGGRGTVLCAKCGGNGQRAMCTRCGGQGFATCAKCNGTGQSKTGFCDECGGEGVELCAACRGDGRKR